MDDPIHQRRVGLLLATLILVGWGAVHVFGVFFLDLSTAPWWVSLGTIALSCWLFVGMFMLQVGNGLQGIDPAPR